MQGDKRISNTLDAKRVGGLIWAQSEAIFSMGLDTLPGIWAPGQKKVRASRVPGRRPMGPYPRQGVLGLYYFRLGPY